MDDAEAIKPVVIAIRETTDRLFRQASSNGALPGADLAAWLRACADGLSHADSRGSDSLSGDGVEPIAFETALAVSALSLLDEGKRRRIRICRNCDWLFLDLSRNSSRIWCDMAVCGNRRKASRHYHRRKAAIGEQDHA